MKRVLAFLAVATAILAVSCNKEQQGPMSAEKNTVTFTVNADQLATRAVTGTHGTANRLQVGVYLKSGETFSYIEALQQTKTEVEFPTTISLDLARNETYKIVFWADEGTDAYTINWANGSVAETATTIGGNLTNRDAFYKMVEVMPTGSAAQSVTLVRPLAQINVGTNDLASYKAAAAYTGNIETQVVVTGVAPGLNLLSGAALSGEAQTLTFTQADNLSATLTSGDKSYDYLALNYVLCPADNTLTAAISIRKDDATADINAFTVSNMPVKPNYRTNVVGKLLTGTVEYTVDVDANFADDLNKQVGPIFASVEALNAYFETMAENSDNGDIVPEVVTLSASATMGPNETIKLPKIATKVVIRVNAKSGGKLTFTYGDGAGADEKPNFVDLYISHVHQLAVDLDDSHVELLAYSSVDEIVAATGPGTFVIQHGAKVGTVNIQKGNTEVSGQVHQIEVAQDATADGTDPVEVFLHKESAVDQIVLNAKTDVVVEQPANNIDVEATENKVSVYIATTAGGSTATAQNGGQIYVEYVGADADIVAKGTDTQTEKPSSVYIKEVKDDVDVLVDAQEGGQVEKASGVDVDEVIRNVAQFDAAVAAKKATMIIGNDIAFEKGYLIDFTTAIDLQGNTLSFTGTMPASRETHTANYTQSRAFKITGSADFTVKDGEIALDASLLGAIRFDSTGKLLVEDLKTNNSRGWGLNFKLEKGTAELKNVEINSTVGGGLEVNGPAVATISGCKFTQTGLDSEVWISTPLSVAYGGVLTVASGEYSGNYGAYVYTSGGTINLNGGSVTGTKAGVIIQKDNASYTQHNALVNIISGVEVTGKLEADNANCLLTITGGTFEKGESEGPLVDIRPDASAVITGGTFSEAPGAAYMPEGYSATLNSNGKYVVAIAPTEFNVSTAAQFIEIFSSNAINTKNTQININDDIDLSSEEAHSPIDISNMDNASITVNGNNHIIKGMKKPMFDQCFVASIAVSDLTFKDCKITEASNGYVAAIVAYFDAGKFLNIRNVTFDNCDVSVSTTDSNGSNYAGLIYGAGGGYGNQNDGPVHMGATVYGCTIKDCDLQITTGGGSVGAIAGHAAWNKWTKLTVENCSITNSTMKTSKANKAGSFFGTVGCAGETPLYGRACGIYLKNCTWSGNTATANNDVSPHIFGRVAQTGGELCIYDPEDGDYVVAAHNSGDGDVIDQPDLVSEDRFSKDQ